MRTVLRFPSYPHVIRRLLLSLPNQPSQYRSRCLRDWSVVIEPRRFSHNYDRRHESHNGWKYFTNVGISSFLLAAMLVPLSRKSINAAEKEDARKTDLLLQSCRNNDLEAVRKLIDDGVCYIKSNDRSVSDRPWQIYSLQAFVY